MGVLNVTPDSFSDGGCFADTATAVAHGLEMHAAGADYVDVGGESTRPGADRVDADEECRRVLPVIRELSAAGVRTSVDTTRAEVAEAAIEAGATLVNDVSGGLADKNMAELVAEISQEIHESGGDLVWGFQKQLSAYRKGLKGLVVDQSMPWIAEATFSAS